MTTRISHSEPLVRRYGLNTAGRIFMLDDDQPDEIAYFANLEDHRRLLAEIERLRSELTQQSALWQTALGHAAEQDKEIKDLREQRAALADALSDLLRETAALDGHPPIGRARAVGHEALPKAGR